MLQNVLINFYEWLCVINRAQRTIPFEMIILKSDHLKDSDVVSAFEEWLPNYLRGNIINGDISSQSKQLFCWAWIDNNVKSYRYHKDVIKPAKRNVVATAHQKKMGVTDVFSFSRVTYFWIFIDRFLHSLAFQETLEIFGK